MLPDHQYRLEIIVNWQGIDKNSQFINVEATQQWLLIDGISESHPYVQQYKVVHFLKL